MTGNPCFHGPQPHRVWRHSTRFVPSLVGFRVSLEEATGISKWMHPTRNIAWETGQGDAYIAIRAHLSQRLRKRRFAFDQLMHLFRNTMNKPSTMLGHVKSSKFKKALEHQEQTWIEPQKAYQPHHLEYIRKYSQWLFFHIQVKDY